MLYVNSTARETLWSLQLIVGKKYTYISVLVLIIGQMSCKLSAYRNPVSCITRNYDHSRSAMSWNIITIFEVLVNCTVLSYFHFWLILQYCYSYLASKTLNKVLSFTCKQPVVSMTENFLCASSLAVCSSILPKSCASFEAVSWRLYPGLFALN